MFRTSPSVGWLEALASPDVPDEVTGSSAGWVRSLLSGVPETGGAFFYHRKMVLEASGAGSKTLAAGYTERDLVSSHQEIFRPADDVASADGARVIGNGNACRDADEAALIQRGKSRGTRLMRYQVPSRLWGFGGPARRIRRAHLLHSLLRKITALAKCVRQ
ncbi:hypothetical protein ABUE29_09535 [Mesorhizobium sp. ZMM04-4]